MTKEQAQAIYRAAWRQRQLAQTEADRKACERVMDGVQGGCTEDGRPGPEWEAFIDTLPGYREHWAQLTAEAEKMTAALERKLRR